VLGTIVADAATMGLHWIYQADKVTLLLLSACSNLSCPLQHHRCSSGGH
jgi:hypothetical protein